MNLRGKAFWSVAVPLAVMLGVHDAALGAVSGAAAGQPPIDEPMASRSGIQLTALDRSADPCSDFYQFACGGWLASHPVPADRPEYGRFQELQDRNNEILKDILENAAADQTPATPELRKIGDYYASCIDEKTIDARALAPLEPDLKRVSAISSPAGIPAALGHLHDGRRRRILLVRRRPRFQERVAGHRCTFGQGGLGLPDRDYYLKTDPASVKLRDAYEQHVSEDAAARRRHARSRRRRCRSRS